MHAEQLTVQSATYAAAEATGSLADRLATILTYGGPTMSDPTLLDRLKGLDSRPFEFLRDEYAHRRLGSGAGGAFPGVSPAADGAMHRVDRRRGYGGYEGVLHFPALVF